jgi:hypothetical protein
VALSCAVSGANGTDTPVGPACRSTWHTCVPAAVSLSDSH